MHTRQRESLLRGLAARQHGVASVAQLQAIGFSHDAIERRTLSRRFRRVYRGVYAVGPVALTRPGRELAAVLACGEGAALSHQSAGRAWLMMERPSREIHVTCARSRPPGPGIVVHRSPLGQGDRVILGGLPVTTAGRTLVDLADVLTAAKLADVVNEAEVQRRFDLRELEAARARAPGRRGRRKLDRVLDAWTPPPFTRTEAERLFLALCKRHGLPPPRVNTWLGEQEVDFYWETEGVVVEVDGGATHMTRRAFEEDRRRDRRLAVMGIQVLRVTWYDLHRRQGEVAAQLHQVLAARSPC
jgi:very-short-patch-repair endonuclease